MKMKKWLAMLLTMLMLCSLVACGKTNEKEKPEYTAPTWENGVFTSSFSGLTIKLDETWTVLSQEEIEQVTGAVAAMTTDEKLKETLSEGKEIYELYACTDEGSTLNITVTQLGTMAALVSAEDVAEEVATQLVDAFGSIGFTDVTAEAATFTFAGAQEAGVAVKGDYMGINMYETQICRIIGEYTYFITACTYGEDMTGDILALFQSI